MREYLEDIKSKGQLRVIEKQVSPRFELAAITRLSQQRDDRAVLFKNVSGTGFPVISNVYGSRERICRLIGASDGNFCQRWEMLCKTLEEGANFGRQLSSEQRIRGSISELPAIQYFEKDAGSYLTSAILLAKHPATGVSNLSFHRAMYVSDEELRIRIGETHDLHEYFSIAEEKGEPLPAAMLIGTSPSLFISACASLRKDEDELEMASVIDGAAVPMVDCDHIDLQVPAQTEIVIEGRILPGIRKAEGPFGEFMGYYVPVGKNHVFEVLGVSWRKDPVFHALVCGSPEDIYPLDYATASRIYRSLKQEHDDVLNVACYPFLMNTIVQVKKKSNEQVREIMRSTIDANHDYSKTCMVVDEDVDLYNLEDVWWAYLTRGRADTRAEIIRDLPGFYRDEHRDHWGRLLIDATMPLERSGEFERKQIPGLEKMNLDDYL